MLFGLQVLMEPLFGLQKVLRGLTKSENKLYTLFTSANLYVLALAA